MKIGKKITLVGGVVLTLALGIGCGSSDSDATPLAKSSFTSKGNAICQKAEERRREDSESLGGSNVAQSGNEEEAIEMLSSSIDEMTEELSDLGAPEGDGERVDAILAAFEAGNSQLEGGTIGPELLSAFAEANELAVEYGLTDCTI